MEKKAAAASHSCKPFTRRAKVASAWWSPNKFLAQPLVQMFANKFVILQMRI